MPVEELRTDKALLAAYVADGDEKAFAEIVERHGPMVYRVCYRILRDHHACEDAVQAVFAILVKKARSIRRRGSVSSWLHGTARNVALYQLRQTVRKRKREEMFAMYHSITKDADQVDESTRKAILDALDRALAGLSARQREAVVLRYLQGRSVQGAAAVAGCSEDALRRRASDGLDKLRKRLSRRGLAVGAGALAAILAGEAQATVPTALTSAIVSTSQAVAASVATGTVSSTVVKITEGVMRMMFWAQVKTTALVGAAALATVIIAAQTVRPADTTQPAGTIDPETAPAKVEWLPVKQVDREATLELDYGYTSLSTLELDLLQRTGVRVLYPRSMIWQVCVLLDKKATLKEIAEAVSEQNDMTYEFVEHESGRTFLLFWGPEEPLASWPKMPGILDTAKRLAKAEDPNDRMRALMHLRNIHSKGGLRLLLRIYVNDEDARVRQEALVQLGRYGKMVPFAGEAHWPPARAKLAAEMRAGTRGRQEEVARRVIGTADPHLLRIVMKSRNPYIRGSAVKTFASLNAEDVFETLRKSIRTGNHTHLADVAQGLAQNPSSEAAEMLGELFDRGGLSNQNRAILLRVLAGSSDPKSSSEINMNN